jgi:acyl-CoA synthetase (AMP-forming)/AMP-acid ligase II
MSNDTLGELLAARTALGDKPLLVADQQRLTYGEADRRSARVAGGLMAAGVRRGDRVAFLFGNKPEFVVAFLAVARIGAVAMPLSTMSTEAELEDLLDGSDAQFLISDRQYRGRDLAALVAAATGAHPDVERLEPRLPALRRVWIGLEGLEAAGAGQAELVAAAEAEVTSADAMVIVHTSGSTSRPKGVIHTHGAILSYVRAVLPLRGLGSDDRLFSNSPFFWIGGLVFSLVSTIGAGSRLICSSAKPAETLDLIEAERPNLTNGFVGTIMNLVSDPSFAARDLSFIRGGNLYPLVAADVRPADPELRYNLLGMTETASVCLIGDHERDLPEKHRGSFGRPVPGFEMRIVDPETGEEASEGELWVRGRPVMQGYYGKERRETFVPGGWYRTNDIFRVDEDGQFYFRGRHDAMIKTAGANVSPREVEMVLTELSPGHIPIVFGLPDPERGQIVVAVLVGDAPIDPGALREWTGERLSRYKVPRRFVAMPDPEVPKLSSGKVDMKRLAEVVRGL